MLRAGKSEQERKSNLRVAAICASDMERPPALAPEKKRKDGARAFGGGKKTALRRSLRKAEGSWLQCFGYSTAIAARYASCTASKTFAGRTQSPISVTGMLAFLAASARASVCVLLDFMPSA